MDAAILTIGTEITSGEIINRNAADLARKLEDLNIHCLLHISVPDDRKKIAKAFRFAREQASILMFTGGLGPTSDDLTREVIADELGLELCLDKATYEELAEKFKAMNRRLAAGHKNQCSFPIGAQKFKNPKGHAMAFLVQKDHLRVYALPGPPVEIEAVWEAGVADDLKSLGIQPQRRLYKWTFEGLGESEIAEVTERIFNGSGFCLGYRAHRPQVIVKVWVPLELDSTKKIYFEAFERELQSWLSKQ